MKPHKHFNEHIITGSHRSYTKSDGSWKVTTPDEIDKLIVLLIYFGLVSTKCLQYGILARSIMPRTWLRALMALLHVVDPATETSEDKSTK